MNRFLVILIFLVSCSSPEKQNCQIVRAAFDIGSGATKMKVAKVDRCRFKIISELGSLELPVGYKEDLQKNKDEFSWGIQDQGLKAIDTLILQAKEWGAEEFLGVATAAFRQASNGQELIDRFMQSGLSVKIIDQKTEALIGLYAVKAVKPDAKMIWDIGGGSMQITALPSEKAPIYYLGNIGAVSFKEKILSEIQKRSSGPNPINATEADQAISMAKSHASQAISEEMKSLLRGQRVIGIGGVHFYSIRGQLKKDIYTAKDIRSILPTRLNKSDEQIGGDYASTEVSNLLLVLGYMEDLELGHVEALKINLSDGILAYGLF